jgi:hypothetical protein
MAKSGGTATFILPAAIFIALIKQADQPAANSWSGSVLLPGAPEDENLTCGGRSELRDAPPSRPPEALVLAVYSSFSTSVMVSVPLQKRCPIGSSKRGIPPTPSVASVAGAPAGVDVKDFAGHEAGRFE